MPRLVLDDSQVHPAIREEIARHGRDLIDEVRTAVAAHSVVVVGMAGNPFPRKARKLLDGLGIAHHDLDYGSYFSQWRRRNALKMWTGWPTFPMVFVKGVFVGGCTDLERLAASGELKKLIG